MESPKRTSVCGIELINNAVDPADESRDVCYLVCHCGWTYTLAGKNRSEDLINEYLKHNPFKFIMKPPIGQNTDNYTMPVEAVEPDPSTVIKTENRGLVNIVPKPTLRLTFKLSPRSKAIELTPEQARELQRQLNQVLGAL